MPATVNFPVGKLSHRKFPFSPPRTRTTIKSRSPSSSSSTRYVHHTGRHARPRTRDPREREGELDRCWAGDGRRLVDGGEAAGARNPPGRRRHGIRRHRRNHPRPRFSRLAQAQLEPLEFRRRPPAPERLQHRGARQRHDPRTRPLRPGAPQRVPPHGLPRLLPLRRARPAAGRPPSADGPRPPARRPALGGLVRALRRVPAPVGRGGADAPLRDGLRPGDQRRRVRVQEMPRRFPPLDRVDPRGSRSRRACRSGGHHGTGPGGADARLRRRGVRRRHGDPRQLLST
ncbi:hypothetical protein BRADI_3g46122v3 [Brachypodium distachyon]|uniref:Uncharacterized protein n=1 Tax=Brachypodium distachyon TaxID=15368 RepID=A0A2K2D3I4_BRADI|nr:hypothetical protein BRADI_3g46122v3 [Brachypodium distachyon]